jgi:hypothetical protein
MVERESRLVTQAQGFVSGEEVEEAQARGLV